MAFTFMAACSAAAGCVRAEEVRAKPWKDSAEISLVSTNGNSRNMTMAAKNLFEYSWKSALFALEAGGLRTKSQSLVTAEQYFGTEKLAWKADDRNYVFERVRWDRDRFAGIRNRYDMGAGAGRTLWKSPSDDLFAEAGPGIVLDERLNGLKNNFAAGRAYAKVTHQFNPGARFSQDFEYLLNFKDTADSRHSSESAVTATVSSRLSIKMSYLWKRVNMPAPGFIKDDTTTAVALIAAF